MGLAKTVHQRVVQAKVKKLAEVYITLGFDEIKVKAGLKDIDVQQFLAQMICRGHLSARIDEESRTVQFVEEVDLLSLVDSIDLKNRRIVSLVNLVRQREEQMRTDQHYIMEQVKREVTDANMVQDEQSAQRA